MMRGLMIAVAVTVGLCAGSSAYAANKLLHHSVESAKANDSVAQEVLSGSVRFYWGKQSHPAVVKKYGNYKTSKRANGFMKSDEKSCAHALASALIVFRDRAQKEGGNAVINLQSNIKNNPESSTTQYSCLAGKMMVNVALKGDVVRLKK